MEAIKKLLDYGVVSTEKTQLFYMNYNKLANKIAGKSKANLDDLPAVLLRNLSDVKDFIILEIYRHIAIKTPFKNIYGEIKKACTELLEQEQDIKKDLLLLN